MWVQLNDHLLPRDQALVSVFDRGFMYGDGVFETMRAYNSTVFRLSAHLDRLGEGALNLALGRLKKDNRTLVVISHRPRILDNADKILVLLPGIQTGPQQ